MNKNEPTIAEIVERFKESEKKKTKKRPPADQWLVDGLKKLKDKNKRDDDD